MKHKSRTAIRTPAFRLCGTAALWTVMNVRIGSIEESGTPSPVLASGDELLQNPEVGRLFLGG